jgi:alpha-beta hydrolase superfamily lysophospholipase
VIVTGCALRSPLEEQTFKVTMARLLSGLLPKLTMQSGLPTEALSRDPQVVQAYTDDPLVHDLATPRLAAEGFAAGHWALEHAAEFPSMPLLLMHGSADQICYLDGTHEFAGQVSGDCTLQVWEGLYHEIHNEPEQGEVLGYVVDWLNKHLPA